MNPESRAQIKKRKRQLRVLSKDIKRNTRGKLPCPCECHSGNSSAHPHERCQCRQIRRAVA